MIRRLRVAGVAANVAEDLIARCPAQQICDALEVLPASRCSNAAGWLVRAISDGWQLHHEAERLRATHTLARRRHDDAQATEARQEQRDRRLAGWTAAISDALTDTQLTAAVDRVTRPVDGLDHRSVPVAASQLLAWAITTATSAPDKPLHDALTDALHDHSTHRTDDSSTLPAEIPRPPATPTQQPILTRFDDASSMRSTSSRQRTSPVSRSSKEQRCTVGTRTDRTSRPP